MCHVFEHNQMKYTLKEKEDVDRRATTALSNRDDNNMGDDSNNSTNNDSDDDINDGIINDSNDEPLPGGVFLLEVLDTRASEEEECLED